MTRRRNSSARRRGFTLMEMLCWVVLVTGVVAAAGQLFSASTAATRDATKTQTLGNHFDAVIHRMRADAWSADEIAVPDDASVVMRRGDGQVTWRVEGETLSRVAANPGEDDTAQSWEGLGFRLRFAMRDDVLRVSLAPGPSGVANEVALLSQVQWLRSGGQR